MNWIDEEKGTYFQISHKICQQCDNIHTDDTNNLCHSCIHPKKCLNCDTRILKKQDYCFDCYKIIYLYNTNTDE